MSSDKLSTHWMVSLGILVVAANLATAQAPSPTLLVVLKGESALAIVDPTANKVVARVSTGESPHEVVASSDGKFAFVTNYGGDNPGSSISIIDLAARKELRRVEIGAGSRPHGIVFAGGKVYFTAEGYKLVGRYDPASNKIDWVLGTGQNRTHMLVLSKDMDRIFTANMASDNIAGIDGILSGPPDWKVTVVPVGKAPEAIDISPDGGVVWTAWRGGLSIIDAANKKVIETFNPQIKQANRLKFTPDGKQVLISDVGSGDLVVLDAVTRKEIKRFTQLGNRAAGIVVIPDGSRAYVALTADNAVATINLRTLKVMGSISTGVAPDGLAWAEAR